ncbi:non-lysosomal glucosylceramidase [Schistocerca serialis cubense]|uniref:non-lysosomal glucosylceramidase n=2 Tax=Schistocerca TaxID=7008 RepID=UPI00214F2FE3|nr:non-lysosomal glucosylceramidase [Schistocerca serialis cubense]
MKWVRDLHKGVVVVRYLMNMGDEGSSALGSNATRFAVPQFGWKVKLDHVFPERRNPHIIPTLKQVVALLPLTSRYLWYVMKIYRAQRKPLMDYLKMVTGRQIYGVPLGGIGCGTIGRGFKGEFCRYQLKPGVYEYALVHANQFIITIQSTDKKILYQKVLSSCRKPNGCLGTWDWEFEGSNAEYCGLYPRAWTVFDIPEQKIRVICRQISPVIPHNYKDSSLPGGVFVWLIENNSGEDKHVSITFTFKNGVGTKEDKAGGCWSEAFQTDSAKGVLIHHTVGGMPCTYAISAKAEEGVNVSHMVQFDPNGNGKELWEDLQQHCELTSLSDRSEETKKGKQLASAVCAKTTVPKCESREVEFALVWDMPKIHFHGKAKEYYRYYTKYFGKEGNAAPSMCSYLFDNYKCWENEIEVWQKPVLSDLNLPDWYKSALFNELYYVSDGGSVWLDMDFTDSKYPKDPRKEYGQFAYLEGHEYRMYNTYDVHFYASFALAKLWPKLQETIQYNMLDAIENEIDTVRTHLFDGHSSKRKVKDTVPHDIGDPEEEPFLAINSYPIHDVSEWRDLNLKFVLQCYRDYCFFDSCDYLEAMWPKIKTVMNKALTWDEDNDGLIENSGFADQTFDAWIMKGPSAYCGSLWIAALYCSSRMAEILNHPEESIHYSEILARAKEAFNSKLWNGEYYNFDASNSSQSKSIMADQLCGLWYLRACGVTEEVFPAENVKSALNKIFTYNVLKFKNGQLGAVNGMMPSGQVDAKSIQSEEVWCGVVYGLAALMIHEDMIQEAFTTAKGIYNTVYNVIGLGYQTPEALYEEKHYRSVGYMRPLSIWGMQHAWEQRKNKLTSKY